MEDLMEKMGELLSDEESMKQLTELARMFASGTGEAAEENAPQADSDAQVSGDGFPDLGQIMKLTGIMGAVSQRDKNTELLLALRPHLREERQKRVDKALKLLKLIAVWNMAKESGLLNDLL